MKILLTIFLLFGLCLNLQAGQLASQTAGLVGLWHLETSTPAIDSSGRGHNGAPSGGVWFVTGKIGTCYNFDGVVNSEVRAPETIDFRVPTSSAMTTMCWFYHTSSGTGQAIFGQWSTDNDDWLLHMGAGNTLTFYNSLAIYTPGAQFATTDIFYLNIWYHVTVVYDDSLTDAQGKGKIYINGILNKSSTGNFRIGHNLTYNPYFCVAGDALNGNSFAGFIDEVAYFNRALSAAEIKAIYNDQQYGRKKTDEN